jgi:hypothetical protein
MEVIIIILLIILCAAAVGLLMLGGFVLLCFLGILALPVLFVFFGHYLDFLMDSIEHLFGYWKGENGLL